MDNNSMQHWGIPGQKHGIRRYQYRDGTLTPLGRIRYRKMKKEYEKETSPKTKKEIKKREMAEEYNKLNDYFDDKNAQKQEPKQASSSNKVVKKTIKELTNDELSAQIKRLENEKKLKELMGDPQTKKGKSVVGEILADSGKKAAGSIATSAFIYLGQKSVQKMFGNDVYSDMFGKSAK